MRFGGEKKREGCRKCHRLPKLMQIKNLLWTRGSKASSEYFRGPNKKTFSSELPLALPRAHAQDTGASFLIKNIWRNQLWFFLKNKKCIYFTKQRFGKWLSIKLKHFAVIVSRIQRRPANGIAAPCGLVRLLTSANKLEWGDRYQWWKQHLRLLLTSYLVLESHCVILSLINGYM